jgi:hypothetical protein
VTQVRRKIPMKDLCGFENYKCKHCCMECPQLQVCVDDWNRTGGRTPYMTVKCLHQPTSLVCHSTWKWVREHGMP